MTPNMTVYNRDEMICLWDISHSISSKAKMHKT